MNRYLQRIRRSATVVVAVASMTAVLGVPGAGAAYDETYCGDVYGIDGVYARSCFIPRYARGFIPAAKIRVVGDLDPAKWTACTINVAIFERAANATEFTRRSTESSDCLWGMQRSTENGKAQWYEDSAEDHFLVPKSKTSYMVVTRWYGTYDGVRVGIGASGPFPRAYLAGPDESQPTDSVSVATAFTTADTPGLVWVPDGGEV